ncbi:MAG: TDP-N-acetylfucosamine:lipid II N-acetylfucosaminyltransferase [Clostridiales bacterium]|nr:TDP-N-acetylfucosamine:lipid II N-acetylfucosaminyltransferase [Clostridiales bacterium]
MDKLRILNIVSDEKFIDNVINFHDLSKENADHSYSIVGNDSNELRFVKQKDRINRISTEKFLEYLNDNFFDAIILHNLLVSPLELLPLIPSHIAIIWSAWGYDLYQYPADYPLIELNNVYRTATVKELKKQQTATLKGWLKFYLKKIPVVKRLHYYKLRKLLLSAVKRIDFFTCVLSSEYELAKKIKGFKAEYVEYKYYDPSRFGSAIPDYVKNQNILIGNSANPSNNHLDIFEKLQSLGIKERELIIPINYGGSEVWRDTIQHKANELDDISLNIICDYMPVSDYYNLIGHCAYAIFYHERQQAMGNIYFLLETGCKIFLSETSTTYRYLKERNFYVYSVQTDLSIETLNQPLTPKQMEMNRQIVRKLYSDRDEALNVMQKLYDKLWKWKSIHNS